MAGFDDLKEQEWREFFAELRVLVISSGFASWDASMMAALEDSDDPSSDVRQSIINYARTFGRYLKVRSSINLERLSLDLGELVRDADGRPVRDAVIRHDQDGNEHTLLSGDSDDLIRAVAEFAATVADDGEHFDDDGTAG